MEDREDGPQLLQLFLGEASNWHGVVIYLEPCSLLPKVRAVAQHLKATGSEWDVLKCHLGGENWQRSSSQRVEGSWVQPDLWYACYKVENVEA